MKPVFSFYADAGHGWLRVPKKLGRSMVENGVLGQTLVRAYSESINGCF